MANAGCKYLTLFGCEPWGHGMGQSAKGVRRRRRGFATHVDRSFTDGIVIYWLPLEQVLVLGLRISVAEL